VQLETLPDPFSHTAPFSFSLKMMADVDLRSVISCVQLIFYANVNVAGVVRPSRVIFKGSIKQMFYE